MAPKRWGARRGVPRARARWVLGAAAGAVVVVALFVLSARTNTFSPLFAPPPGKNFTIIQFTDSHIKWADKHAAQYAMHAALQATPDADLAWLTGDMIEGEPPWHLAATVEGMLRPLVDARLPWAWVHGNHEYAVAPGFAQWAYRAHLHAYERALGGGLSRTPWCARTSSTQGVECLLSTNGSCALRLISFDTLRAGGDAPGLVAELCAKHGSGVPSLLAVHVPPVQMHTPMPGLWHEPFTDSVPAAFWATARDACRVRAVFAGHFHISPRCRLWGGVAWCLGGATGSGSGDGARATPWVTCTVDLAARSAAVRVSGGPTAGAVITVPL